MTRRPAQAAALLALVLAIAAAVRWWNSPERRIRAILDDVAAALTHDAPDQGLQSVSAAVRIQPHLALDVLVETAAVRLAGRQDVIAAAARLRASAPGRRVRFFDPAIELAGDDAAELRVTAEVTVTDEAGENIVDVHEVEARLSQEDGRWVIASARTRDEVQP